MITYIITGDSVDISDSVRSYVEKRFAGFERFMDEEVPHELQITISKNTAHQREDTIQAEVKFKIHTRDFLAIGVGGEVLPAIDMAKEELMREVTQSNAKRRTLFHRGARKIKSLLKGMSFGKK
jgi:ribosomal subunit interface protein